MPSVRRHSYRRKANVDWIRSLAVYPEGQCNAKRRKQRAWKELIGHMSSTTAKIYTLNRSGTAAPSPLY